MNLQNGGNKHSKKGRSWQHFDRLLHNARQTTARQKKVTWEQFKVAYTVVFHFIDRSPIYFSLRNSIFFSSGKCAVYACAVSWACLVAPTLTTFLLLLQCLFVKQLYKLSYVCWKSTAMFRKRPREALLRLFVINPVIWLDSVCGMDWLTRGYENNRYFNLISKIWLNF